DLIRPHVAYYVGGMGTFYRDILARFGFSDEAMKIHSLWQTGQRKQAIQSVSNELISQVALAGSAEDCRRRLAEYRAAGVDMPIIVVPHGAPHDVFRQTLEA